MKTGTSHDLTASTRVRLVVFLDADAAGSWYNQYVMTTRGFVMQSGAWSLMRLRMRIWYVVEFLHTAFTARGQRTLVNNPMRSAAAISLGA